MVLERFSFSKGLVQVILSIRETESPGNKLLEGFQYNQTIEASKPKTINTQAVFGMSGWYWVTVDCAEIRSITLCVKSGEGLSIGSSCIQCFSWLSCSLNGFSIVFGIFWKHVVFQLGVQPFTASV